MPITPIYPNLGPGVVSSAQLSAAVAPPVPPTPAGSGTAAKPASGPPAAAAADFPGLLKNLLGQINDLAQNADRTATQAAAGQDVDLHQLMLSMDTASLGFDLAVQVRNRLMEAYQEIIKMQV